ncbi:hypothetical protein KW803_02000 [Candidatus Saccharibacteria bacterium]|nr:hypothetical protein [Candidatus Saccharibacteria bacterium]
MATVELSPHEEHFYDGLRIYGEEVDGEIQTFVSEGWKLREFRLVMDALGGHIDYLQYENDIPLQERALVFSAIAAFARARSQAAMPESIITVEDPDGNLL